MEERRSPVDVGVEVVAGLIAIAGYRRIVISGLRDTVETAVVELDPHGLRDRSSTWWDDHPWTSKPDAFDRLRRSFDDLWLLETQAQDITDGLRSMLGPVSLRRPGVLSPVAAHHQLVWLARRRADNLDRLENAIRGVRAGLSKATAAELRRAVREVRDEEKRGVMYRERLGRLLSMAELVDSA